MAGGGEGGVRGYVGVWIVFVGSDTTGIGNMACIGLRSKMLDWMDG